MRAPKFLPQGAGTDLGLPRCTTPHQIPLMLAILYEDNHLLAVSKPAGLATMGLPDNRPTLLAMAKQYIRERYAKPGNVYLGVVSRLDAPVTGVVVLARTSKAARRLTEQFRNRSVEKTYWALVEGRVAGSGWTGCGTTSAIAGCIGPLPATPARRKPGLYTAASPSGLIGP